MIKNTYDSLGRITGINHSSHNDKTLADYHYKWDAANRITEINDDKYGYDKTSQLLSAVYAKKPKEQYAYDLNGNRSNHRIGGNNQLLNDGKEEYQYDAEGNRTSKGNTKYHWDHRNRLVKVVSPSETIEYTYDYQNRLVKRSAGKNNTHFIHDGWQIVRQCENGKPVKRFLWGTKQDELICENDNWTLGDHLNTIREVVNSDGKVIAHCDYNAFGKRLNVSSDTLSFAYTGKLIDNTTGLQWNINRWYDANVGKWISEDPIGFKGKDENLYRYVKNETTGYVDNDGRGAISWLQFCKVVPPQVFLASVAASLVAQYIWVKYNECTGPSPSASCNDPIDFCFNIKDGLLTTIPETATLPYPLSFGANCKRPCYSSSWLYCCNDKKGVYEGWGAYKCVKSNDGSLGLVFHMRTGIKNECNAAACSTWSTCTSGSFIYYNP